MNAVVTWFGILYFLVINIPYLAGKAFPRICFCYLTLHHFGSTHQRWSELWVTQLAKRKDFIKAHWTAKIIPWKIPWHIFHARTLTVILVSAAHLRKARGLESGYLWHHLPVSCWSTQHGQGWSSPPIFVNLSMVRLSLPFPNLFNLCPWLWQWTFHYSNRATSFV